MIEKDHLKNSQWLKKQIEPKKGRNQKKENLSVDFYEPSEGELESAELGFCEWKQW